MPLYFPKKLKFVLNSNEFSLYLSSKSTEELQWEFNHGYLKIDSELLYHSLLCISVSK